MEDCIVREVREFNKLSGLFLLASSMKDENAKNYKIEEMQKRWSNYLMFNVLEHKGRPISFSGVYKYSDNLVRVVDRLFTLPEYRQKFMSKDIKEKIRPRATILYLTRLNCLKKKVIIVSFQYRHQRKEMLLND